MNSWLAFTSKAGDRYVIGPSGYFIELPDGHLSPILPRIAFPVVDRFPCLSVEELQVQTKFGPNILFAAMPCAGSKSGGPRGLPIDSLILDIKQLLPWRAQLNELAQYVIMRLYETGMFKEKILQELAEERPRSIGRALIAKNICSWEYMVTICMDIPAPAQADPPDERRLHARHEWQLVGEILITLGKINRTNLAKAIKIQRDGGQVIGQVLATMKACTQRDIEECLILQKQSRQSASAAVAMIGQLLVSQGIISADDLEQAMRTQKVGRQSLQRVLVSMGACSEHDIESLLEENGCGGFQSEIDDYRLGEWLVTAGTIMRSQLDEALRIQLRGRQVLGEMLVSMRYCSPEAIESILGMQKQIRRDYQNSIEKLGFILLKRGMISSEQLEKALSLQSGARQPLGCILVSLGACQEVDVALAIRLQRGWKEYMHLPSERLGELLVKEQVITSKTLDEVLPLHLASGKPLGQTLIERNLCTPEQIIDVLLTRDIRRQRVFQDYLRASLPAAPSPAAEPDKPTAGHLDSFFHRLKSWAQKLKLSV